MNYYTAVLQKYTDFSGRARRKEYWMFALINAIISLVLYGIDSAIGTGSGTFGVLGGLYSLAVLLPSLAVGVRRLHDIGKSGWWLLIALVPLIGGLYLLFLAVQDSNRGDNAYGPDPKAAERVGM